jgi:hypothetical protein
MASCNGCGKKNFVVCFVEDILAVSTRDWEKQRKLWIDRLPMEIQTGYVLPECEAGVVTTAPRQEQCRLELLFI